MSVAAPSALLLRRRSTLEPLALDPSLELGAGGEARVFAVPGDRTLVAKIYHQPTVERARKVALMIEEPPRIDDPRAALAWPVDLLLGEGGRIAGFLMPRAEGPRLFELYNPITRRRNGSLCDYAVLHRAGAHLAAAFDALHARGYVVGDVNESNVLLKPDGTVTLVDTDSFQVRDPEDGTIHRSKVGKAEFTPPELQGRSFADFDRTPEHDRFGLGALLFLALMEGTHPFAGRMEIRSETPPVEERIRRGLFPHHGHPEIRPPRLAPPFAVLDPEIRALFVRCFADGHADPSARPAAAEWRAALSAAEARLETCGANPRHRFGPHLDACPWCERTKLLHGRDPFPATPTKTASRAAPPRRKVPAPPRAVTAQPSPPPARTRAVPAPALARPPASAVPARPATGEQQSCMEVAVLLVVLAPMAALIALLPFGVVLLMVIVGVPLALRWVLFADQGLPARRAVLPAPVSYPALPAPAFYRLRFEAVTANGVDAAPVLLNRAELEDTLAGFKPPAGVKPGDWTMRAVALVRKDGTVDPPVTCAMSPVPHDPSFTAAADRVARARLRPFLRGGKPTEAWVTFDITCEQS